MAKDPLRNDQEPFFQPLKDAEHKPVDEKRACSWHGERIFTGQNTKGDMPRAGTNFKAESSQRMSKDIGGASKAYGCWC